MVTAPLGMSLIVYYPVVLIAVLLVFVPFVKQASAWLVTLVHETGHNIIMLPFSGLRGGGISVNVHGDGETSSNPVLKPVLILSLLMGYGFPIYFGFALLIGTYFNLKTFNNTLLIALTIILLISIRSWFTGVLVLITSLITLGTLITPWVEVRTTTILLFGFILLIKGITELIVARGLVFGSQEDYGSDFEYLEEEAFFDRKFWYIFMVTLHVSIIVYTTIFFLPVLAVKTGIPLPF